MLLISVLAGLAVLVGMGALFKMVGKRRRRRVAAQIPEAQRVRQARDVPVRVMLYRTGRLCGLNPRRAHRLALDLVMGPERVILATHRGALADVGPGRGLLFESVRCTGPGRLVFEGQIAQRDGTAGQYRFEAFLPDAAAWAQALQPFVKPDERARFATVPPWMAQ